MPGPITLTITYDKTGVNVNGPIDNQLLCYGLLEMARDAVAEYSAQQAKMQEQRVQPVSALPPGLLRP